MIVELDDTKTPLLGQGTIPSPNTPTLQFVKVTDPLEPKNDGNRKQANSRAMKEYARGKRHKFLQRVYSETQAGAGQSLRQTKAQSRKSWMSGCEGSEPSLTPSSSSDGPSDYFSGYHSKPIKTEPLSPLDALLTPPISRSEFQSFDSGGYDEENPSVSKAIILNPQSVFSASRSDPFHSYPVKFTPKMEALIDCFSFHCRRSESSQPFAVFSSLLIPDRDLVYAKSLLGVKDPGSLHSVFPILFRLALTDPPLLNTLLFIGEFGSRGKLTEEALRYQGNAIRSLNEKLQDPKKAMDNATVATILFLSGFEVIQLAVSSRKLLTARQYIKGNNRPAHEAHMAGLAQLLKIRDEFGSCQLESMDEREVIERGMFW
jgi:hypothetical protein